MKKLMNIFMLLLIVTSLTAQTTITVCQEPGAGCDYTSIQDAINAAPDGALILVSPGYYEEGPISTSVTTTGLIFGKKGPFNLNPNLTLRSTNGAAQTVIDVTGSNRAVVILPDAGTLTIDGFTFIGFNNEGIVQGTSEQAGTVCRILNNRVINGSGEALGGYGTIISVGSTGSLIKGNYCEGAKKFDSTWGGSGIIFGGGDGVIVENNIVDNSDVGIVCIHNLNRRPGQATNSIIRNNISRNCISAFQNDYKVINSRFENNQAIDSDYGFIQTSDERPEIQWDGQTKITTGGQVGLGAPVGTVLSGNNFYGNGYNGYNFAGSDPNWALDIPLPEPSNPILTQCNWWGDYTGPYHETLNPSGLGSGIYGNTWILEGWSTEKWTDETGNCNQPLFWETENTGYSVRLNWDPTKCGFPAAQSYIVHIREKGTQAWLQGKSVEPTRKIFSLQPGVRYQVRVLFYSGANWNIYLGFKGIFEFSTKTTTLEKIQDIGTAFLLDWDEVQSADSYIAHIKEGNNPWQHTALTTNSHTRVFSRKPGFEYAVRVLAFKGGQYIGISPEVNVTANIVNFNVTKAGTEATISWPNLGAVRYVLHYKEKDTPMWIQANANVPSRKLINLTPGKTYQYRLLAYFMVDGAEEYGGATGIQEFIAGDGGKSTVVTETIPVVNVYPNPFVDVLNIEMEADADKDITYTIVDVTGKVVKTGTNNVVAGYNTITVNVAELPAGIYVINADNQSFTITK